MRHLKLDLTDGAETPDHDRPLISIWPDEDRDGHVALSIGPTWGNQQRFVTLTPTEAKQLARLLNKAADMAAEAKTDNAA